MIGGEDRARLRLASVALVILAMFGVLVARLWYLQVLSGKTFARASERNHVRIVSVQAPRGRILDSKGRVLVANKPVLAVEVFRDEFPKAAAGRQLKQRLASLLDISVAQIDARLADRRFSPYEPVRIAEDVSENVVFTIRERQESFPGVGTDSISTRVYPHGALAGQILGYVNAVNEQDLRANKGYGLNDLIGRSGIESVYEPYLRGAPGLQKLEVDASGRVLSVLGSRDPVPGNDVLLTLDLDVQRVAERALRDGIRRARSQRFRRTGAYFHAPGGATVALDPRTGDVLAMASYPTFNPITKSGVETNGAIRKPFPPGSTFKPILATAALATGRATPGSRFPCTSTFTFGDRVFHNWRPESSSLTVADALVESCDTVFYRFGRDWWLSENRAVGQGRAPKETMQIWARQFGLGAPTGIDLPGELDGRIPDRAWRRAYWEANKAEYCRNFSKTRQALWQDLCERGYLWRGGDAVNMSIGQGDVEATPLQMAVSFAAIANTGKVLRPHLADQIRSPKGVLVKRIPTVVRSRVKASRSTLRYVQRALGSVVSRGTASFPYRGWPLDRYPMAAKTGSAESQSGVGAGQPHSWFATYGPLDDPRYVIVTVVEQAGFGSQVAGPVSRRIMDELFGLRPLPIVYGTASD